VSSSVNYYRGNVSNGVVDWYVMVRSDDSRGPFRMWTNTPCVECKNGGTCNIATGQCQCKKGYTQVDCGKSKSSHLWWIIVIAVGGAIVLSIAIGVPVALYLRSRSRAKYERV